MMYMLGSKQIKARQKIRLQQHRIEELERALKALVYVVDGLVPDKSPLVKDALKMADIAMKGGVNVETQE